MNRWYWGWVAWLAIGLAYEVFLIVGRRSPADTLSEFTGYIFRAASGPGWYALMFFMGFLAAWYPQHVRRLARNQRPALTAVKPDADDQP